MYCAIDANMELAEEEDCFHVFGYLKKLRQSRKGLIENVVSDCTLNKCCVTKIFTFLSLETHVTIFFSTPSVYFISLVTKRIFI